MKNFPLEILKKAFIILILTAITIPGFSQDPLINLKLIAELLCL